MTGTLPDFYRLSAEVEQALAQAKPLVALESTVITHGLPYPQNRDLAAKMEVEVRKYGAVPATIAVISGIVQVGVTQDDIEKLSQGSQVYKISVRDFAPAIALGWSGGTTVAATMLAARRVGISVFATGGIGGVHRQAPFDVSADLPQLARTPMIVVCAGAKAILDLPATLEYLETWGVPVVGYQCEEFPAFYSRSSGLRVTVRADSPEEVVSIAQAHWRHGLESAILVVNPPPEQVALEREFVEAAIERALKDAEAQAIHGQQVTPFLLKRVTDLTEGRSLQANLGLLLNNARLASLIACRLSGI